jgi:hypothetical protein
MLEDAQTWLNKRSINEVKDRSGTVSVFIILIVSGFDFLDCLGRDGPDKLDARQY